MNSWPYNTTRWQRLREVVLAREPLCHYCAEIGKVTPSTVVDHSIPVKKRPDLAFALANLVGCCAPCHDGFKQRLEKTGVHVGCGTDGVPLDPNHPWGKT